VSNQAPNPQSNNSANIPPQQEASQLNWRTFLIAVLGLIGMIVFIQVFALVIQAFFPPQVNPNPAGTPPPGPRLQVAPPSDLEIMKFTAEAQLNSYGWVNRDSGIVHIPIQQAMQLVAQGGTPAAAPAAQTPRSPQAEGAQLFQQLGCTGCHGQTASPVAPTLNGLFGQTVSLTTGESVIADEAYLRESILQPQAKIVAGYQPIMPSYQGRVTDEQLTALIEYIKSVGSSQ